MKSIFSIAFLFVSLFIYVFDFWHCRGSFWKLFLVFEKNLKLYLDQKCLSLGGQFSITFLFQASLYMIFTFWNHRGSFLYYFFNFENFEIVSRIRLPLFGCVYFLQPFYFSVPYRYFFWFSFYFGIVLSFPTNKGVVALPVNDHISLNRSSW